MLGDLVRRRGDQDLAAGLEELLDAVPGVGDQAGAGAGGLEDPGRPARSRRRHAVAVDVEHGRGVR